ncbi:Gamma-aminobutyric acid type B receptor subunit 1 [Halotydeus destructor]|nr:Gamma-aminobutyric acid type B receptor subunit 1 [Halotydeus destructor]
MKATVVVCLSAILFANASLPEERDPRQSTIHPEDSSTRRGITEPTSLHIGGLFPITGSAGWLGGTGCLPAARMALNDVNEKSDLLPGYQLVLHWNDSQCNPGLGANVLYDLIYNPPIKLLVLGGCSIVCSTVAETAKMYNLVVVGYGSSSPALSNRKRFPTFFRTHPSATIHNPTRVELFKRFGWTRIAIILEAEEVFVTTGKDLESRCKEAGIDVISRVSFLTDAGDAVKSLVRQDARIIVGMFYGGAARKVMCEAYKQNLYGKQHVWLLIGWYEDNWWHPTPGLNCTKDEMMKAVQGHFTTEALLLNQDSKLTIANMTSREWLQRYHHEYESESGHEITQDSKPEGYQEAPLAYDAIWAVALALNRSIQRLALKGQLIESFDYTNGDIMKEIQSSLRQVRFLGVSGLVAFSDAGDRIAWTQIEQMVDGKYNLLGYYDTQTDNLTWFSREQWLETEKPPPDRTIIKVSLKTVSDPLYIASCVTACVGILFALLLLLFNYKFRQFRYIQMSHPLSNNFMLLGCILCLTSVAFFGMDGIRIPQEYFILMCEARAWTLSLGFSLCFGSMFIKTWISYRLSTSSSRNKKIKDGQTYMMLSGFCLSDILILLVWHFHSPMVRKVEIFPLEAPDHMEEDIKIQPQLEHCDANLVWYGILYGYKGLLLIFGLFLAYETRSVKLKQINDSRLVGMSIYNVVILCMITGPVSLVISNQVNAHFSFVAFTIIFCCFLSMALVFVPKVVEMISSRSAHGLTQGNGTFHETMTTKEEEEKLESLLQESEELKSKIKEKETQIEEVGKQLEELTKEKAKSGTRKAVRICEPASDIQFERTTLDVTGLVHIDPVSDSGYCSTRTPPQKDDDDNELSESYL